MKMKHFIPMGPDCFFLPLVQFLLFGYLTHEFIAPKCTLEFFFVKFKTFSASDAQIYNDKA